MTFDVNGATYTGTFNVTGDSNNIVQDLKVLSELYESGILTKEEFEKAKKKILN